MRHCREFERWMRFTAVLYLLGGILFAVFPEFTFISADRIARAVLALDWQPHPATPVYHWATLGVAMMFTIATCSALAGRKAARDLDFAIPVMVSKGVSSIAGLALLGLHDRFTIYFIVVLTDLPLMLLTWWFWSRAREELGR